MTKKLIFIVCCILISELFLSPEPFAAKSVKVGVYQNKPLIFRDSYGEIKGIFADILSYVAKKEDWEIEYVSDTWSQSLESLRTGRTDVVCAVAYSRKRNEIFDFNYQTVLTNWGQIYINRDSDIESILDLKSKKVAVLKNDVYFQSLRELVKQFGIECRFVEAFEYDTVLKLVEMGKCDAGLVGHLYGHQFERDFDVYETSIILSPKKIHFAVLKKENRYIVDALDFNLRKLKEDKQSVYYQSIDKWIGGDSRRENRIWYLFMLGGAGCLVLAFFALNIWHKNCFLKWVNRYV